MSKPEKFSADRFKKNFSFRYQTAEKKESTAFRVFSANTELQFISHGSKRCIDHGSNSASRNVNYHCKINSKHSWQCQRHQPNSGRGSKNKVMYFDSAQRISALFDANCPVINQTKLLLYLVLDLFPAISSFSKENFLFKKEF